MSKPGKTINTSLPASTKKPAPSYSTKPSYTPPASSSGGFKPHVDVSGGGSRGRIHGSAEIGGSYTSGSRTLSATVGTAGKNFQGGHSFSAGVVKRF